MEEFITRLINQENINTILQYGLKLFYAILTLWVGLWVIKMVIRLMTPSIKKTLTEESVSSFVLQIIATVFKILLGLSIASMLGIEMTSFLAILGSVGLAIGLALQGSLTNFAGGILILATQPFKKDDYIKIKNYEGFVSKIELLHTTLRMRTNQVVIIPNSIVSNDVITNYHKNEKVRKTFYVTVTHDTDIEHAMQVVLQALKDTPVVLEDPAPDTELAEITETGLSIRCLAWTIPKKYFGTNEPSFVNIKKALDAANIKLAVPSRVIYTKAEN